MIHKYVKNLVWLICLISMTSANAAKNNNGNCDEACDDKFRYKSSKPCNDDPCDDKFGYQRAKKCKPKCVDPDGWNTPLPPYTPACAPDCHPYPPRPYCMPMQGLTYMWTFGGDFFVMYLEPKSSYTSIFRSKKVGGTVYLAQRFRNPFGYEFGLSYTDRKPKTLQTNPGDVVFNTTANATAEDTGRVRIKITYLDAQFHTRLCKFIESKFILGVGWVRQGLEFTYVPVIPTEPVQNAMRQFEGRTAWTIRAGIGAQALITDRVGCRFILMYQNMGNIQFRGTPPGITQRPFHDSLTGSIGLYWTFLPLVNPHNIDFEHDD